MDSTGNPWDRSKTEDGLAIPLISFPYVPDPTQIETCLARREARARYNAYDCVSSNMLAESCLHGFQIILILLAALAFLLITL